MTTTTAATVRMCDAHGAIRTRSDCRVCTPPAPVERTFGRYIIAPHTAACVALGDAPCPHAAPVVTVDDIAASARMMGHPATVTGMGGNIVAAVVTVSGVPVIVAIGDGITASNPDGDTWSVSLDDDPATTTDDLPITTDADGIVRDAVAWVRHVVFGDPIGD